MGKLGGARPGAGRKPGSPNKPKDNVIQIPKQRGGARPNAGRKAGTGKYGEATTTMRVPVSMQREMMSYMEHKGFSLPVYSMRVPMGAAAPSIEDVDYNMNLNEFIKHPDKTFFHPVQGDSMEPTVFAGDLAMIDAAIQPMHNDVVLAMIDGNLTLKRLIKLKHRVWLEADNKKYDPIMLDPNLDNLICGVMLISIRPISTNHIKTF